MDISLLVQYTKILIMAKKVTSKIVAEIAGVSQSAVSRVFTPGASVSQDTREKIIKVANCLGYRPNAIARSLSTRSTKLIGLIIARMGEPFYADVLNQLTARLQKNDYHTLLLNAYAGDNVDELLTIALRYQVDGLVCASSTFTSDLAAHCASCGVPLVIFHRFSRQDGEANIVRCDHFQGAQLLAEELAMADHRRIAFIAGVSSSSTSRERERGLIEGLTRYCKKLWARVEVESYEYRAGYEAAGKLLQRRVRPDAIFAFNDVMAMAVIDCARELGVDVPGALSVVGFDGLEEAERQGYNLTTIRQPVKEIVEVAVTLLLRSIMNPEASYETRIIPGTLIRGGSARLLPEREK